MSDHHISPGADLAIDRQVEWVERYTPLLLAQAHFRIPRVLRRVVDAGDIVHDVWVAVLPKIATLELKGISVDEVLMRYLSTSLVNRVNDLSRRHARGAAVATLSGRSEELDPLAHLPLNTSGIITKVHRSSNAARVHELIESLGPEDKEVVCLRGIEQRSLPEVAALTGKTEKTVAQRYRRAMKKLRDRLPESWLGFPEA